MHFLFLFSFTYFFFCPSLPVSVPVLSSFSFSPSSSLFSVFLLFSLFLQFYSLTGIHHFVAILLALFNEHLLYTFPFPRSCNRDISSGRVAVR
jgi:hypothetical protein